MAKLKLPYFGKVLVEAIQELDNLDIYSLYDNFKYFQVLVPGYNEPFTGSILGNGGEFYGLNLFVGNDGLQTYRSICDNSNGMSPERMRKFHLYAYEIVPCEELSEENRKWLKAAGVKIKPYTDYPDFSIYKPGKVVSVPEDREVSVMLYAVNGLLKAVKTGVFAPSDLDHDDYIFTIKTSGKPISPQIEILKVPLSKDKPSSAILKPIPKPQIDLSGYEAQAFEFRPLPHVNEQLAVGSFALKAAIGDDLMSMLMLIDIEKGPRQFELLTAEQHNDAKEVWDVLRSMIKGKSMSTPADYKPCLPQAFIFFEPELHAIADKVLSPLGVECRLGDTDSELYSEIERIADFMNEQFVKGPQKMLEEMKGTIPDDVFDKAEKLFAEQNDDLPADDDYESWCELDGRLKAKIFNGFDNDKKFKPKRALIKYFGSLDNFQDVDDYDDIFHRYHHCFVVDSYCSWFVSDYRSSYNNDTILEKWLDDPKIDDSLKYAIDNFSVGINSFYKMNIKSKKNGRIVLTDMFDVNEYKYEIIDFSMAATAESGLYMPAKVYRLGNFDFYASMGPVLNKLQYDTLMRVFENAGVDLEDDDVFDKNNQLFGSIWKFYELLNSHRQSSLRSNADGDPLIIHHCIFSVDKEKAVREKLQGLSYIDYDKNKDMYLWFRPNLLTPMLPGFPAEQAVILGTLKFQNGKLIVDVNSQKRYDKCRKWLDKIEGLSFVKVERT